MLLNFSKLYKKYNLNIKGIIHIGAHYGEEIVEYVSNEVKNVTFFEPISSSLKILEENLSHYADKINIDIFPYALGNDEREVEMYVSNRDGMCSSILKPKIVLTQYPDITFETREVVKMIRLDNAEIEFDNFNFLNIDVQGYELEVLKGSKNTLNNVEYIYTEINRDEVYENTPHVEKLDEFLDTYGFCRVETDWSGETWGDAFYTKGNINV
jgi:FkbM family methyltransferase